MEVGHFNTRVPHPHWPFLRQKELSKIEIDTSIITN